MVDRPDSPAVIQTHLSDVFLSAQRVYKLLRPVRTTFLDFTDRGRRVAAAQREYELNHRISPDVYLGTADVIEGGELVDRMIVMRRLPADRQLDRLVDAPDFQDRVHQVARLVASFHARQTPVVGAAAEMATAKSLWRNWEDNFAVLEPLVGSVITAEDHRRLHHLAHQFISGREKLFDERIAGGWIRDGHGDLRCEHVFCLDDGPRLIDCLAFRDDFRIGDVLNDVAFLAMDLHRLAGPAAAMWLVERYDELCNEHHPAGLAHHYVAYRAHVRAKVAAIRFGQGDTAAAAEVAAFHRLALQHLEVGQPRLILVGGGAGVGKSTVAAGLADRLAATWLRTDEIRRELAGLAHDQHAFEEPGAGIYSSEFSDRVYREMLREAGLLLARGESVVLDASWADARRRHWATELGRSAAVTMTELHCEAPLAVARERIARRMAALDNPSDATPEIAEHIAANFDPWPSAAAVDTNQPIDRSIEDACRRVMTGTRPGHPGPVLRVEEAVLTLETIGFFLSRISPRLVFDYDLGNE